MENDLPLKLLSDFSKSIENRSTNFLVYKTLSSILDWHLKAWQKDIEYLEKDVDVWIKYYELKVIIAEISSHILNRVLKEKGIESYGFFKELSQHINAQENTKGSVKGQDRFYIEDILPNFYKVFFASIGQAPDAYEIWEAYFPNEWKVTMSGLADHRIIPQITFQEFLRWAQQRISNMKENDIDYELDNISENLFPEVDPITWAKILTFAISSYDPKKRIESIIKKPWIFGFSGRMHSFSSNGGKLDKDDISNQLTSTRNAEEQRTFRLVLELRKNYTIFNEAFSDERLRRYLNEAKNLHGHYLFDSTEEGKRLDLIEIFSGILKLLE
ncbi:MAG: hypothetical protein JWM20_600 [Patescibacteria group bacterium]|nr:hypothetical protein [Patescibacteria group bacterium]